MKGKSKKMILFVSLALVLSTALFGTLAYLTSEAKVTNTFTVGDVKLDLDEAKVNEKGEIVDKDGEPVVDADGNPVKDPAAVPEEDVVRTKEGNEYKLVPGKEYVKDPTVTVKEGSEEAYVRMLVTFNCAEELDKAFAAIGKADLMEIFNGYDKEEWSYAGVERDAEANTITYEFWHIGTVEGYVTEEGTTEPTAADVKLAPLFTSFTVPGLLNSDQMASIADMEMTVIAQAIQAEGFADAKAAWAGFEEQMKVNAPAADDETDVNEDESGEGSEDNGNNENTGTGSEDSENTGSGEGTGSGNDDGLDE